MMIDFDMDKGILQIRQNDYFIDDYNSCDEMIEDINNTFFTSIKENDIIKKHYTEYRIQQD